MDKIEGRLSKKQVQKMVYASDHRYDGYDVNHLIPGEELILHVPSMAIANCIVKALRERQYFIIREQKRKAFERRHTFMHSVMSEE